MAGPAKDEAFVTGRMVRHACREGALLGPTSGLAPGYQQGNVIILPASYADDFLRYCVRNPKPAPILGVGEPGDPSLPMLGEDIDIRRDVPRYRIFRNGSPAESATDLNALWRDDFVTFILGCSFSFEAALLGAGISVRHIEAGSNVAMYVTDIDTVPAGPFGGPMVVSMRPFLAKDAITAVILSSRLPEAHGAPVHLGNPRQIGIDDIMKPEFGDSPQLQADDIPVFWACGVTPQSAIRLAKPEIAIMHEPGHMLVTDRRAGAG